MLFGELLPLAEQLDSRGWHITVETAGTLHLPVLCDLMSISPKLSGSGPDPAEYPHWSRRHRRERYQVDVLHRLIAEYNYQLKFVVDRIEELAEIESLLTHFPEVSGERVLLMPQGTAVDPLQQLNGVTWSRAKLLRQLVSSMPLGGDTNEERDRSRIYIKGPDHTQDLRDFVFVVERKGSNTVGFQS